MYERFTDRARKAMQMANYEATKHRHQHIGTEHILLGVLNEGEGVARRVLERLGHDKQGLAIQVYKQLAMGSEVVTMGRLPQTPGAKLVVQYAIGSARNLGHNYVGTEHLLLGLLQDPEEVVRRVLVDRGVTLALAWEMVKQVLAEIAASPMQNLGESLFQFHVRLWQLVDVFKGGPVYVPPKVGLALLGAEDSGRAMDPLEQDRNSDRDRRLAAFRDELLQLIIKHGFMVVGGVSLSKLSPAASAVTVEVTLNDLPPRTGKLTDKDLAWNAVNTETGTLTVEGMPAPAPAPPSEPEQETWRDRPGML